MKRTSALYKREMAADNRAKTSVRLRLGVMDLDAATTVTQLHGSEPATHSRIASVLQEDGVPAKVYATFEAARMRLNGTQIILPQQNPQAQGYVSGALSDESCALSHPPVLEFFFSKTHKVAALTLTFDRAGEGWPSALRIEAWRGTQKLLTENAAPTGADFTSANAITNFDRLRLTFLRTAKPFHRVRLQQIIFGIGLVLDGDTLQSLNRTEECDPLSRRLPVGKISFTVDNTDGKYNPDHPSNRWELMEQQSPIWLEYGQYLSSGLTWGDSLGQTWAEAELHTWRTARFGGTTEMVNGGRYYLTAQPTVQGTSAQFEAHTLLDRMTQPFVLSTWRPAATTSLYDLATAVLEGAALPLLDSGQKPWKLWSGLKSIKTAAYLPKQSEAECLQLIAHAACCCLFVDRDGYLCIAPAPTQRHDYALDFDAQTDASLTVEKTPTVRSVACKRYTYAPEGEPTELHRMTYNVSGSANLFVEFSGASTQLVATATGASCTLTPYVHGARLLLQVPYGETKAVEVVVTGRALKASTAMAYYAVAGADEHGSIETVENPLLTESASVSAVGKWVASYLARRTAYRFTHRGEPALEALDIVSSQSLYDPNFAATVVHSALSFDGAFTASAVLKRI